MTKDVFKRIIADSQEKDLSYVIERDISRPLDTGKIISLIGVKRSGKTHVLYSLIKQIKKTTAPRKISYRYSGRIALNVILSLRRQVEKEGGLFELLFQYKVPGEYRNRNIA